MVDPADHIKTYERRTPSLSVISAVNILKGIQNYDYLMVSTDEILLNYLLGATPASESCLNPSVDEEINFSDQVIKINKEGKEQKRALIITNQALYNFRLKSYKEPRRRIPISDISGVILSRASDEMVIQVRNSYDYRYSIKRRADVVEIINRNYERLEGKKLNVFISTLSELKDVVMTKDAWAQSQPELRQRKAQNNYGADPLGYMRSRDDQSPEKSSKKHFLEGFRQPGTEKEGWLTKRRGKQEKWDLVYVVLGREYLSFCKARIKGNIYAVGCKIKHEENTPYTSVPTEVEVALTIEATREFLNNELNDSRSGVPILPSDFNYYLTIQSSDRRRPLEVCAANKEALKAWNRAFQEASMEDTDHNKPFVHYEGWLLKKDPTSGFWRRRYFVLHMNRCWYYEMQVKGQVKLSSGVGAHNTNQVKHTMTDLKEFAGLTSSSGYGYQFNISEPSFVFNMAADSRLAMESWIASIEKQTKAHDYLAKPLQRSVYKPYRESFHKHRKKVVSDNAPEGDVTIIMSDIQASTSLWENYPDEMDEALEKHDTLLRSLLNVCNGYEVRTEGDSFIVTFSNVEEAVLWALLCQKALLEAEWPEKLCSSNAANKIIDDKSNVIFSGVRVRMGIHKGIPTCKRHPVTDRMDYYGEVMMTTNKVSHSANGGQIVMTEVVHDNLQLILKDDVKNKRLKDLDPIIIDLGLFHLVKSGNLRLYQILPADLSTRQFSRLRATTALEMSQKPDEKPEDEESEFIDDVSLIESHDFWDDFQEDDSPAIDPDKL